MNPSQLYQQAFSGCRQSLAKCITLLESSHPDHKVMADKILLAALAKKSTSIRIGISGPPGVGKSSYINLLGHKILNNDPLNKLAILAVDPTSPIKGGSILGDKTRMLSLSERERVYIRPSPNHLSHGGVSAKTREVVLFLEACQYNWIIIETVGVGQSEHAVHSMVDGLIMLQNPVAGDEIQGIKKGSLDLADIILITKCDESLISKAKISKTQHEHARSFQQTKPEEWKTSVLTVSIKNEDMISESWREINKFITHQKQNKNFDKRRSQQRKQWFDHEWSTQIQRHIENFSFIQDALEEAKRKVSEGKEIPPITIQNTLNKIVITQRKH